MDPSPLLAGLDVGTTNIKALIFTPDGQVVAQASRPTPTQTPQPGWAHYDPEALWQTTAAALREAAASVEAGRIVSVAAASMGEAAVPLDAQSRPLYPAIAWFDPRTLPQAEWLDHVIGKDRLFAITGLSLQPIFGLCKLLWLKQNEPDVFARAVRWLNIADYIAFRLSGEQATDLSLASRTLALDLAARRWSDAILGEVGIAPGLFAPLVVGGTPVGRVTPEAARDTGLPTSAQVCAGGHDHVCGALAAGVIRPGVALNSLGTAETLFVSLERPLTDPQLGRQGYTQGAHVVPGLYYVFGSCYTAGGSIEWFKSRLAEGADYAALIAEAEAVPPGSGGVCFLPHLQLASSPYDDPGARGAFLGLGLDTTRGALFRAVLEGIACDSRQMVEALLRYDGVPPVETIYAIGGLTRNPLLMRIKAAVLNRAFDQTEVSEAASLGAAILGGLGAGVYADVPAALAAQARETRRLEPDPELTARYAPVYAVFQQVYPAVSPLHHALRQ